MISAIQNNNPVYFRGCRAVTNVLAPNGAEIQFNHQTSLFRNLPELMFIRDYAAKHFPNGTHIADFACSQGQEAHSLAVLFSDINQNKKYKITGLDVLPRVLQMAKRGIFVIEDKRSESFLFDLPEIPDFMRFGLFSHGKFWALDHGIAAKEKAMLEDLGVGKDEAQRIKELFREHFSVMQMTPDHKRIYFNKNFEGNEKPRGNYEIVKPNLAKFDGILDFQEGDLRNADVVLADKRPGIVLAHNVLYHITGAKNDDYTIAKMPPAREVFDKIHRSIQDDGIFSIANLSFDHLQSEYWHGLETVVQNNQKIKVSQNSPVHKELRNAGFEPIFYTKGSHYPNYVPSVWKKS